jgi:hypothetical protein
MDFKIRRMTDSYKEYLEKKLKNNKILTLEKIIEERIRQHKNKNSKIFDSLKSSSIMSFSPEFTSQVETDSFLYFPKHSSETSSMKIKNTYAELYMLKFSYETSSIKIKKESLDLDNPKNLNFEYFQNSLKCQEDFGSKDKDFKEFSIEEFLQIQEETKKGNYENEIMKYLLGGNFELLKDYIKLFGKETPINSPFFEFVKWAKFRNNDSYHSPLEKISRPIGIGSIESGSNISFGIDYAPFRNASFPFTKKN